MEAKRIRAVVSTSAVLALGLTAAAGAAPGDTSLAGTTTEGVKVKLTVAQFGNATAFKIGGTQVECANGTLTNKSHVYAPLDTSDPGEFTEKDRSSSDNGGFHFVSRSSITGASASPDDFTSWSGTFANTTKVFKKGQKIDTCRLKTEWITS
jgi:hypothetical protein